MRSKLRRFAVAKKNHFGLSEWSGAIGDFGTTLPLAFGLIIFNGFPPERIFLLWGLAYIATGWIYRVPVSVQPLKAMAVIAMATGYSIEFLSTTSLFYGILLLLLSISGAIRWLEKWFSPALIGGIQLGIGLILAYKALELSIEKGFYLGSESIFPYLNLIILGAVIVLLWFIQFKRGVPLILFLLLIGGTITFVLGISLNLSETQGAPAKLTSPDFSFFLNSLIYLMIPQLPLTLGNAVFAASDACHTFWKEQAQRVNPTRLGSSIGISNIFIGILGGFPICHGAGGIAAHSQFGGKTGGTTIILGSIFVISALIDPLSSFLFYIPIPILAAMLLFSAWRMMLLIKELKVKFEWIIAIVVGIISFTTKNLTIALIVGFLIERLYIFYKRKNDVDLGSHREVKHD